VIGEFLTTWSLFAATYLAGWGIAFLLALVGVWVVARDQIFLGVAVAQASTLGVAVALWLGMFGASAGVAWLQSDAIAASLAVGCSIATALLTARETRIGAETAEAVTGWVFLLAASLPVLLLARSPHGLEEVHQLMFSTILGASVSDAWIFGALAALTCVAVALHHPRLLLFVLDPEMAAAVGMRRGVWNALVAIWLGLAVGLAIRVSGTLYTFGCLVLPALIAKNLASEIRPLLVLAPMIGVGAAIAGFVWAHTLDTPPAHTTVALLCALLLAAWTLRRARQALSSR
jgi:ABC-type Mn2+/Zn2+ transport system permease subunit